VCSPQVLVPLTLYHAVNPRYADITLLATCNPPFDGVHRLGHVDGADSDTEDVYSSMHHTVLPFRRVLKH
jgi:hypothetical protein